MSVIIKDMDMPIDCLGCRIILCDRESYLKSGRPKDCPLNEVVRCKDCKWYDNRYGDVCHNPRYGDGHANYPPPYVDEDYWCKDGERKGGDDE